MKTTANYGLKKPDGTDLVDIENFNYNADIIDTELAKRALKTDIVSAPVTSVNGKTGAVTISKSDVGLGSVNNWGATTAVNSTSTTTYATASAVKQAYDKGVEGVNAASTAASAASAAQSTANDAKTAASTAQSKADDAYTKAEEAFQSASDGKKKIATAITGKGVTTNATDTFAVMAANIAKINSGATVTTGRSQNNATGSSTYLYVSGVTKKPIAFLAYVEGYNSSNGYFPTDQMAGILNGSSYKVVGFGWKQNANIGVRGSMSYSSYGQQMVLNFSGLNYISSGGDIVWYAVY